MESPGEPGRIWIGEASRMLVRDQIAPGHITPESRGRIPREGKGETEAWFVSAGES